MVAIRKRKAFRHPCLLCHVSRTHYRKRTMYKRVIVARSTRLKTKSISRKPGIFRLETQGEAKE
jgi:hypothetical protein